TAGLNFLDTAVADGVAHQLFEHQTNARLALPALADDEHHPLTFGAGDETVAQVLLQGGDVLSVKQVAEKGQPAPGGSGLGVIGDRQTVAAEQLSLQLVISGVLLYTGTDHLPVS